MFIYHSVAVFVFFIDDAEVWAGSGFVKSIIHIWCFMYRKIQYGTLLCTCIEERLSGSLVHWRSEGLTYVYGADTVHWLQVNILFGLTSTRFPFALFGLELYCISVNVLDVFQTSFICSIYCLCPGDNLDDITIAR